MRRRRRSRPVHRCQATHATVSDTVSEMSSDRCWPRVARARADHGFGRGAGAAARVRNWGRWGPTTSSARSTSSTTPPDDAASPASAAARRSPGPAAVTRRATDGFRGRAINPQLHPFSFPLTAAGRGPALARRPPRDGTQPAPTGMVSPCFYGGTIYNGSPTVRSASTARPLRHPQRALTGLARACCSTWPDARCRSIVPATR